MKFLRPINSLIRVLILILIVASCNKKDQRPDNNFDLTIFFLNDYHGQIDNFSKVKHIIDLERENTNVIVAGGGDIFSGNPVVDYYPEKGYPMIDMMNRVGFDVAVVGNHEYVMGKLF
jgi:5'-nucleotidase/UDP-sugar diphosphatase